ncbi:hypothetical protein PZA11_006229 [Diplocarpon coronariae]
MKDGQNSETSRITIVDGKKQLQSMVDKILEFLHKTRRSMNNGRFITYSLPAGSKISLQLAYTDATPDDYQPESFHPGNDSTRKILDLDTNGGTDVAMETGFHSVNCTINFPGLVNASKPQQVASTAVGSSEVPRYNGVDNHEFLTDSDKDSKRIYSVFYNASPELGRAGSSFAHYHSMPRQIVPYNPPRSPSMRSVSEGDNTQPDLVAKICQAGSSRILGAASQDTQQYFTDPASPVANFNIPHYSQEIWNELRHFAHDIATHRGDDDLDAPQSTRNTPATTANVLDSLIHEKLVIKNQDTSKSHKKKKTLATYTLIGDEESVVRAYFDPRKGLYALCSLQPFPIPITRLSTSVPKESTRWQAIQEEFSPSAVYQTIREERHHVTMGQLNQDPAPALLCAREAALPETVCSNIHVGQYQSEETLKPQKPDDQVLARQLVLLQATSVIVRSG